MIAADSNSTMLKTVLTENHKDMYQWFLFHQECLLLGHERYAGQCLTVYKTVLTAHIDFENTYLLTPGALNEGRTMRWQPSVYRQEHDKILALFAVVEQLFARWLATAERRKKRLILLTLLEKQLTLRHVIAHHEEREEQDLFESIAQHYPDRQRYPDQQQYPAWQQHPNWQQIEQLLERYNDSKSEIQLFLADR